MKWKIFFIEYLFEKIHFHVILIHVNVSFYCAFYIKLRDSNNLRNYNNFHSKNQGQA